MKQGSVINKIMAKRASFARLNYGNYPNFLILDPKTKGKLMNEIREYYGEHFYTKKLSPKFYGMEIAVLEVGNVNECPETIIVK